MRRHPGTTHSRFNGVIPPLVTPLTTQGDVDLAALRGLVDHFIAAGVDGLFLLGSTGEGAFLTDAQRREVVETAATRAAGRVPVLAGAVDMATTRVVGQGKAAIDAGADAIVVTAPYYGHASVPEIAIHYTEVATALNVPIVAYGNPAVVHIGLDVDMLAGLAHDGVIAAVKDSSGDVTALRRLLAATASLESFTVFTGSEVLTDVALALGAHGVVPGLGNVDAAGYVRLYRAAYRGDRAAATAEQRRLIELFRIVDVADRQRVGRLGVGVGAFKAAMVHLDLIPTATLCRPFQALTGTEEAQVAELVKAAGLT